MAGAGAAGAHCPPWAGTPCSALRWSWPASRRNGRGMSGRSNAAAGDGGCCWVGVEGQCPGAVPSGALGKARHQAAAWWPREEVAGVGHVRGTDQEWAAGRILSGPSAPCPHGGPCRCTWPLAISSQTGSGPPGGLALSSSNPSVLGPSKDRASEPFTRWPPPWARERGAGALLFQDQGVQEGASPGTELVHTSGLWAPLPVCTAGGRVHTRQSLRVRVCFPNRLLSCLHLSHHKVTEDCSAVGMPSPAWRAPGLCPRALASTCAVSQEQVPCGPLSTTQGGLEEGLSPRAHGRVLGTVPSPRAPCLRSKRGSVALPLEQV